MTRASICHSLITSLAQGQNLGLPPPRPDQDLIAESRKRTLRMCAGGGMQACVQVPLMSQPELAAGTLTGV